MEETGPNNNWIDKTWNCTCGALNAGWLDQCGRCKKQRYEKH